MGAAAGSSWEVGKGGQKKGRLERKGIISTLTFLLPKNEPPETALLPTTVGWVIITIVRAQLSLWPLTGTPERKCSFSTCGEFLLHGEKNTFKCAMLFTSSTKTDTIAASSVIVSPGLGKVIMCRSALTFQLSTCDRA